jgi:hypothetical protein
VAGIYNPWLVFLSIAVAIFVPYTALSLATRVAHARGSSAQLWLTGGAFAMGTGIWQARSVKTPYRQPACFSRAKTTLFARALDCSLGVLAESACGAFSQ